MATKVATKTTGENQLLTRLQCEAFAYFLNEGNPENGLVPDKSGGDTPASVGVVGLALTAYVVGVERGFFSRAAAVKRTLATLRFFQKSEQSSAPDASGVKGFYYHFLDMKSGRRAWQSELSSIDSALLMAGMLACAEYFDLDNSREREIRDLVQMLYHRADWNWMRAEAAALSQGWKPECGFLPSCWQGYNEGLLLYVLAFGSPTHFLPQQSYTAWTKTYRWKKVYGYGYLYAGPLFIHQLPQVWLDLRGVQDEFMRGKGLDYFENSRRATYVQQEYARRNPRGFEGYSEHCWGVTACDGPGPELLAVNGVPRRFWNYTARGAPFGPDDGTLAPWGTAAALPFAPEIVLPAIKHFERLKIPGDGSPGFAASFNLTYPARKKGGWVSPHHFGLNQGPVVSMIENHRSDLLWGLMRNCAFVQCGLQRAGFSGGWLTGV